MLSLKFAQSSLKCEDTRDIFPENPTTCDIQTRNREKYKVQHAKTLRLAKSAIPYMQRLLNWSANPNTSVS